MDIKSEMEIKNEPLESSEDGGYNDQSFEQGSCLEGVKKELIYTFIGIKGEASSFEEENFETNQDTEQIFQLQESQPHDSDENHGEKDVRFKVKSPSRNPPQLPRKIFIIFKNNKKEDELKLESKSQVKEEAEDTSAQAKLFMEQNYFPTSTNSNTKTSTTDSGPDSLLNNKKIKNECKEISAWDSKVRNNTNNKTVTCSYCGKVFFSKWGLEYHIRTHNCKKPLKCSFCDQSFNNKIHLETHILTHLGDKPFKCSYCEKGFNHKDTLKDHIRYHTGENPFKCSSCGKEFNQKGNFETHIQTHMTEKRFKCSYCDKRFKLKYYIKKHIRTHSGEKPFRCSYCYKRFTQSGGLKYHLRTSICKVLPSQKP